MESEDEAPIRKRALTKEEAVLVLSGQEELSRILYEDEVAELRKDILYDALKEIYAEQSIPYPLLASFLDNVETID